MQKDIFDDIFDTKDDDVTDDNDPSPLVPTPTDFQVYNENQLRNNVVLSKKIVRLIDGLLQEGCTCLDNAAILFINTNLLLDYRSAEQGQISIRLF